VNKQETNKKERLFFGLEGWRSRSEEAKEEKVGAFGWKGPEFQFVVLFFSPFSKWLIPLALHRMATSGPQYFCHLWWVLKSFSLFSLFFLFFFSLS
jgi:hypothetical protein